jgi:hypothetical protein
MSEFFVGVAKRFARGCVQVLLPSRLEEEDQRDNDTSSDDGTETSSCTSSADFSNGAFDIDRASKDGWVECDTNMVEVEPKKVECRVFAKRRVVLFQSTREGEEDNHCRVYHAKVYSYLGLEVSQVGHIAVGCYLTDRSLSLFLNGFTMDFVHMGHNGLAIVQRRVDPKTIPVGLKLKVIPLLHTANYLDYALWVLRDFPREYFTFRKCHILASCVIADLSAGWLKLTFETSNITTEPYYTSMKLSRSIVGKRELSERNVL